MTFKLFLLHVLALFIFAHCSSFKLSQTSTHMNSVPACAQYKICHHSSLQNSPAMSPILLQLTHSITCNGWCARSLTFILEHLMLCCLHLFCCHSLPFLKEVLKETWDLNTHGKLLLWASGICGPGVPQSSKTSFLISLFKQVLWFS